MKRKADLLVVNPRQLLSLSYPSGLPRRGSSLSNIGMIDGGALASFKGRIVAVGSKDEVLKQVDLTQDCLEIDSGGGVVMPGFVDCHTHTVFARYRVDEYELRVGGESYEKISEKGGGIAKSVSDLRAMSDEDLLRVSEERLKKCIAHGATTVEIKSGYGLDLENEIKQLKIIKALSARSKALLVSTFLGAHNVPPEFTGRKNDYIKILINEMIPTVVQRNLAEFIDVFSEKGVFEVDEAERILRAGKEKGLKARLHADELHDTGSAELAVKIGAVSADHLTKVNMRAIGLLSKSKVVAVLLPGTSLGLPSLSFAPARELIDSGVPVAIATDFNPGSSPSESMAIMISISCSHMRMSPGEAIAASTYNAAFAVCREGEVGSLEVGKRADFLIVDADDYREIPYRFGINLVRKVFIEGKEWKA